MVAVANSLAERILAVDPYEQLHEQQREDTYLRWLASTGRWNKIAVPLTELVDGVEDVHVAIPESLRGDFTPSSPSIHFNPDGEHRHGIVRGVNYRQAVGGVTLFAKNEPRCRTRNWWVTFDRRWRVAWATVMEDPHGDRPGAVQGFEDARLFYSAGHYWASATFAERLQLFGSSAYGLLCEMALLQLSDDGKIEQASALRGPWSLYHQKNWRPAPTDAEPLRWIYSSDPLLTITPDMATEKHCIRWFNASPWRGSSQAIRVGSHWLWVDHHVVAGFDGPINLYLHRFFLADEALTTIEAASPPFVFRNYGVEFCAGLAIDGDRAVLSYSVRDAMPFLAICPLDAVIRTLGAF